MAIYPSPEELAKYNLSDNIPVKDYKTATSPANWKYIELKGYMFTAKGCELAGFKIPEGIMCLNCHSMVYINKCPNDECYNFYEYCNYTKVDGLENEFWELVYKQHPNLREDKGEI